MAAGAILTPAFLTAALANFLFSTGLSGFVLLPLHLRELGASDGQLGVMMGCYSLAAILTQPVVGAWLDRGGHRAFLVGGSALAALVSLAFAAFPDTLGLVPVLRALQGVAFSIYFIANFTVVVDLAPPAHRGQALGIFGISGLSSTAVGPALGEAVLRWAGFRGLFLAAALVGAVATVMSARLTVPRAPRPAGGEGLAGLLQGAAAAPRLPLVLGGAFGLGTSVMFTFFPTYARDLGVGRVGLFAIAYSIAALAVRAGAGGLADSASRRRVIIPAHALQAVAAGLLASLAPLVTRAHVPGAPLLFLAGLLAGGAHGFLYPALTALVVDLTPPARRGRVVGVFSACILAGQASGAAGFGPLASWLGYGPMFGVLTVALGLACVLALRLRD